MSGCSGARKTARELESLTKKIRELDENMMHAPAASLPRLTQNREELRKTLEQKWCRWKKEVDAFNRQVAKKSPRLHRLLNPPEQRPFNPITYEQAKAFVDSEKDRLF